MPTPLTQQLQNAKREAILVASTIAFATHGFAATTVATIADPLQFSRELLCTHLRGQECRAGSDSRLFLDHFMATSHDATAIRRVRAAIDAMFTGWEELTAALLRAARRAGQIPQHIDPAAHARLLIIALDGFMLQQSWGRFADADVEGDRIVASWFASLDPAS